MHLLFLAQSSDPAGLAGGRWPAPSWAILLAGGLLAALSIGFLVLRARRAKRPPGGAQGPGARP